MRRFLLLLALSGCDYIEHPECGITRYCTTEYRAVSVHVTDEAGTPIAGASHTTKVNGHVVDVDQSPVLDIGDYVVVGDGQVQDGDSVTFEVDSPQGSAVGEYSISTDACNCDHISDAAGPRVLVVF
jgi:hypothetical protein